MAQLRFRIEDSLLRQALRRLTQATTDLTPALKRIGEHLVGSIKGDRFESETAPDGTPWAPLKPATLKRKQRQKRILKTLQERGSLRRSIIYQVSANQLQVGTNLEYAAIHQFGGTIPQAARSTEQEFKISKDGKSRFAKRGKGNFAQRITRGASTTEIPARPFLGVSRRDAAAIQEIVADYLLNG